MSQTDAVLSHLKAGRCLSALDAQRLVGTMRLAARICDLRRRGHRIDTKMVAVRGRHGPAHVAVYKLTP